jgi:hypothetical protein
MVKLPFCIKLLFTAYGFPLCILAIPLIIVLFDKVVTPDTFYVYNNVALFNCVVPDIDNDELHETLL